MEAHKTQPNQLKSMANEQGMSVLELVKEALRTERSQLGASRKLGVAPNTIIHHLRKANLKVEFKDGDVIFHEVNSNG